jgi:hypothetical protein
MQVTQHLPLLATITDAESVIASLPDLQLRAAQSAGRDREDA